MSKIKKIKKLKIVHKNGKVLKKYIGRFIQGDIFEMRDKIDELIETVNKINTLLKITTK